MVESRPAGRSGNGGPAFVLEEATAVSNADGAAGLDEEAMALVSQGFGRGGADAIGAGLCEGRMGEIDIHRKDPGWRMLPGPSSTVHTLLPFVCQLSSPLSPPPHTLTR